MGEEIEKQHFRRVDFRHFEAALGRETDQLAEWFAGGRVGAGGADDAASTAGFELEAWLVDAGGRPAPVNEAFLKLAASPDLSAELARFNVEFNTTPRTLCGRALAEIENELGQRLARCREWAGRLGVRLASVGVLPSARHEDFAYANMSALNRYHTLNEQVWRMRHGEPVRVHVHGREHLRLTHSNVLLEAATTSFQIHLRPPPARAAAAYNAALALAAPLVAISANARYVFGRELWDESRVPLFEQAVNVPQGGEAWAEAGARDRPACPYPAPPRVGLGRGYVDSLLEVFEENRRCFPALLPCDRSLEPLPLPHLRLHNGTVWRWVRPIVGFEADGAPHLRIEFRVLAAGPSPADMTADAALFYGLVHSLCRLSPGVPERLPFRVARRNFYRAAREGLAAEITWLDGRRGRLTELWRASLLDEARAGLLAQDLNAGDVAACLEIARERLATGQNGATWARRWVARHGRDWPGLTLAYVERQESGLPVARWAV